MWWAVIAGIVVGLVSFLVLAIIFRQYEKLNRDPEERELNRYMGEW